MQKILWYSTATLVVVFALSQLVPIARSNPPAQADIPKAKKLQESWRKIAANKMPPWAVYGTTSQGTPLG
jgi:hypothetical protein